MSRDKAFKDGYSAGYDPGNYDNNPYYFPDPRHDGWKAGFETGWKKWILDKQAERRR